MKKNIIADNLEESIRLELEKKDAKDIDKLLDLFSQGKNLTENQIF